MVIDGRVGRARVPDARVDHRPRDSDVHGPLRLGIPADIRGGVLTERPDPVAAKASFLTGSLVWLFWTVFVHTPEAKPIGISQALFGVPTVLGYPWSAIDPLVIALPLSTIVIVAVQALRLSARAPARGPREP